MFNRDKITLCSKNKIIEQYADPIYILQKAPIIIHGSFFGGSIKKLKELQTLYHEALEELYDINISDDDQHVYLRCFIKNPELFEIYLTQNYPNALTYFEYLSDNN